MTPLRPDRAPSLRGRPPGSPPRLVEAALQASSVTPGAAPLWLAIHLPQFALELATRGQAAREACVLLDGAGARPRVLLPNALAARLGVRPGMPLGAARALGALRLLPADPRREARALERLGVWAHQFTPLVAAVPPDGLVLEVGGSLRLFGGSAGLLRSIRRGLRELGYRGLVAMAPTALAATSLARASRQVILETAEALPSALQTLPLEVLRLPDRQLQDFYGIGVRTVGDCLRLPRESLGRRFGRELLEALDRMRGQCPDPRPYVPLPETFASQLDLPWEVRQARALTTAAERLLHELAAYLRVRCAATRALDWMLEHTDGTVSRHAVALATPSAEPGRLARLTRERFSRLALPAPVRGIELRAEALESAPSPVSGELFRERTSGPPEDWPQFLERLRARLGERAVRRLLPVEDHRPERACRWVEPLAAPRRQALRLPVAARPVWLLARPVPLCERGGRPELDGPLRLDAERERIESGWWDGEDIARDYFVATDRQGGRWWIYRELGGERKWYLHGIFE